MVTTIAEARIEIVPAAALEFNHADRGRAQAARKSEAGGCASGIVLLAADGTVPAPSPAQFTARRHRIEIARPVSLIIARRA